MSQDTTDLEVVHNEKEERFEAELKGHTGVLDYRLEDGNMIFASTRVPVPIRNRGVATKITEEAMEYARKNEYEVIPSCAFTKAFLQRSSHAEYRSLLPDDYDLD
ncbi:MAG: GNAT family N-acetyltransferase [Saprospiraceae bacterium]|nr:GNAT family N-acetyltransferase [Saprospiraceae bacterium]